MDEMFYQIIEKIDKIDDKIDKLHERIDSVDKTLIQQHEQLTYHIKRTDILESRVAPVEKYATMLSGAMKFAAALAAIVGALIKFKVLK